MYWKILIVALGPILFSACNEANEEIDEKEQGENEVAGNELEGTEWALMSLNGEPLLEGTNITLVFYLLELAGFAGCNGYDSQYEIDGIGGIKILEIESQAEGCLEPEGVLDQESEYFKQLLNTKKYALESGMLILSNPSSEQTLVYSIREPFEMDPASLDSTHWNLIASESFPLKDGSNIRISFSDGEITGFAGCREFKGEYEAEGDEMVFPVMMMIGELCDDLDLQIQEAKFTTWLELSAHSRIREKELALFLADGNELLFERTE